MPKNQTIQFKLEEHLDDYIKSILANMNLVNQSDYFTQSAIPEYLKQALAGRAKTESKTNFGKPDFSLIKEKGKIPVLIENKLGTSKLIVGSNESVKLDDKSISGYAVNGAMHYAIGAVASGKYSEAIAIGIAGDSQANMVINVYYVYGSGQNSYKYLESVKTLDFLENDQTFGQFYKDAILNRRRKTQNINKLTIRATKTSQKPQQINA